MPNVSLVSPIPTPFDTGGAPDWSRLGPVVERQAPHVDAFLLFGSTGEAVHLTPAERRTGLERVREIAAREGGGTPLWVGVLEETLPQALASAEAAIGAGAEVVLATPPRYYGGGGRREVALAYFRALADRVGDAGRELWLYHVPQLSKVDLAPEVIAELASHPAIGGIKDSSGELGRLAFYQSQALPLTVLTGHAPTLLGALGLGAAGATLAVANIAPRGYRRLIDAWRAGRIEEATTLQRALEPLGRVVGKDSIVLVKDALAWLGTPAGVARSPYPERSPHRDALLPILERLAADDLLA